MKAKQLLKANSNLRFGNAYGRAARAIAKGTTVVGVCVGFDDPLITDANGKEYNKAYGIFQLPDSSKIRASLTLDQFNALEEGQSWNLLKHVTEIDGRETHFMELLQPNVADPESAVAVGTSKTTTKKKKAVVEDEDEDEDDE